MKQEYEADVNEHNVRKPLVASSFTKSWHFNLFQTPPWKKYLEMHLQVERFVSWGDNPEFLKEVVEAYIIAPTSPADSQTFYFYFLSSHL